MSDKCENCRFAKHYTAPKGERPEVESLEAIEGREERGLWDRLFPPSPRYRIFSKTYSEWQRQVHARNAWDHQDFLAEHKVLCRARPEAMDKPKGAWCGLHERAA